MFLEVVVNNGNYLPIKMDYKQKFLRVFSIALEELNYSEMEHFATRVKRTGKSGKALAL